MEKVHFGEIFKLWPGDIDFYYVSKDKKKSDFVSNEDIKSFIGKFGKVTKQEQYTLKQPGMDVIKYKILTEKGGYILDEASYKSIFKS